MIWSFLHGSRGDKAELIDRVPARCAELLAQGKVDCALVPVIEYQRMENVSFVPGVCVGSKREVRSVVLVSKTDSLEKLQSIALDESSRTSAALVKIIFREFLNKEPRWSNQSPNIEQMLENNDGALIIGDPAMTLPKDGLTIWDMASLWRRHTDLGFVFAMWLARNDSKAKILELDLNGARDEGVAHIDDIVNEYLEKIGLTAEELQSYLTENISFEIDESMGKGLRLYYELAAKHKLIELVQPMRLLTD